MFAFRKKTVFWMTVSLLFSPSIYAQEGRESASSQTLSTAKDIQLRALRREWQEEEEHIDRSRNENKLKELYGKMLTQRLSDLPPIWRERFLKDQVLLCLRMGDWNSFQKLEQEIKNAKPNTPYDANMLIGIEAYYSNNTFPPPKSLGIVDPQEQHEYWKKHYQSKEKSIAILKYVVDHYDENYCEVFYAMLAIGLLLTRERKYEQAIPYLEYGYFKNLNDLYALPLIHPSPMREGEIIPAEQVLAPFLERQTSYIEDEDNGTLPVLVKCLLSLPDERREKKMQPIRAAHAADPKLAVLEKRLSEELAKKAEKK